jgi:hypothetical protein
MAGFFLKNINHQYHHDDRISISNNCIMAIAVPNKTMRVLFFFVICELVASVYLLRDWWIIGLPLSESTAIVVYLLCHAAAITLVVAISTVNSINVHEPLTLETCLAKAGSLKIQVWGRGFGKSHDGSLSGLVQLLGWPYYAAYRILW